MDFTTIQHGTLPAGTETQFGVIERSSLTAYLIEGRWVPFMKVHGAYAVVQPLVVLG